MFLLQSNLSADYEALTNEIGIQLNKQNWRAADIAIVKTSDIEATQFPRKYIRFAPEVVIEIDTKAELKDIQDPLGYYHEKTDELLKFGVKKVIWIYTESKKVTVAKKHHKWETSDWDEKITFFEGIETSIDEIIRKRSL